MSKNCWDHIACIGWSSLQSIDQLVELLQSPNECRLELSVSQFERVLSESGHYKSQYSSNIRTTKSNHSQKPSLFTSPMQTMDLMKRCSANMISTSPLVPDPHEEAHVQLGLSLIPGAGQGLSQKTDTKIINNFTQTNLSKKKNVNRDSFNFSLMAQIIPRTKCCIDTRRKSTKHAKVRIKVCHLL